MRNFAPRPDPTLCADRERSEGIPDREAMSDCRDVIPLDCTSHGGRRWQIEPRLGYASCRLRDMDSWAVVMAGTLKQVFRHLSRELPHLMGERNLHA